jgi:hypothetical protein
LTVVGNGELRVGPDVEVGDWVGDRIFLESVTRSWKSGERSLTPIPPREYSGGRKVSKEVTNRFNALAQRMEGLPEMAGVALAVTVTQRLMDDYFLQPKNQRSSFVAHWAEMMPVVWSMVLHPSPERQQTLKRVLKEYVDSDLGQESSDVGQPQFERDAGYACIGAIEAYCGNPKAVAAAASELLADAQRRAQTISTEIGEDRMSTNGETRVLRFQQMELDRLDNAVSLLEREGFSVGVLPQLKELLRGEVS